MKTDRRNFISGMTALASCMGASSDLFGAARPKFGFDISQCEINPKFRNNPLFSGEPICGVNLGFLARRGYFNRESVKKMPSEMREAGVNWCLLNTHFCQETFSSRKVFLDFDWSSGERELVDMIKALHGEGLRVMLKPCLTSLDSAWMGTVTFPSPNEQQIQGVRQRYAEEWFNSLRECLSYFGDIAEETGCEAFIAGAEYNGTTKFDAEWRKTIAHVRKHFSGPVTYEFMPREPSQRPLKWFNDLDFLALSTYPSGVDAPDEVLWDRDNWKNLPPISKASMEKALAKHVPLVESFVERFGNKPILFSEIGTRSCRGCVNVPGDYRRSRCGTGRSRPITWMRYFRHSRNCLRG